MLANVRVLDLSRLLPGPFASQLLCDLGAEVIKVEDTTMGDYSRWSYPNAADGNSITFHAINRGKKSVSLNLKSDVGVSQFLDLLKSADVLLESFRPEVLSKLLGMSIEELHIRYPQLIICSISGYGQTGPDKLKAGHDLNYISRAGVMAFSKAHISSDTGLPTLAVPPFQVADIGGGAWPAAFQIVCALLHRKQTGKGNIIDVSMTDCSYAWGAMPYSVINSSDNSNPYQYTNGRFVLCGDAPCYNVYPCKDGQFIGVGALEPKFWKLVCKAIKAPHLEGKAFVSSDEERKQIMTKLAHIFMQKTGNEWKRIFLDFDACVEVIPAAEHVIQNDKQLIARNLNVTVKVSPKKNGDKPSTLIIPKMPLNMKYGLKIRDTPGPMLGEHNRELLSKL